MILIEKLTVAQLDREILSLLRNSKVHYRVENSLPLDSILSQLSPVHTLATSFSIVHYSIILPPTPQFLKMSLPLTLLDHEFVRTYKFFFFWLDEIEFTYFH